MGVGVGASTQFPILTHETTVGLFHHLFEQNVCLVLREG